MPATPTASNTSVASDTERYSSHRLGGGSGSGGGMASGGKDPSVPKWFQSGSGMLFV